MGKRMVLVLCSVLLPFSALADEPKKDVVKELDLKGLKREMPRGSVTKPTIIASEDGLATAFPEEELRARLKKEVDFTKQRLLFFAWAGSGQDKLDFDVKKGEKGPEVTFKYRAGATDDLRFHFRLYAIPKDANWQVTDK